MSNKIVQNYLLRELKNSSAIDTENSDLLLLNSIYNELLVKIIDTANDLAKEDRSLDILPEHLDKAYSLIMNE